MRQALFAIVLVGASFAGGAAVNGPGLRWAQAWALGRLGLVQEHTTGSPPVTDPAAEGDHPPEDRSIAPLALADQGTSETSSDPSEAKDNPTTPRTPARADSAGATDARSGKPADSPATVKAKGQEAGPIAPEPGTRAAGTSPAAAAPAALAAVDLPTLERPEPLRIPGESDEAAADPRASRDIPVAKTAGPASDSGAASTPPPKSGGRGFGDVAVSLASLAGKAMAGSANENAQAPPADSPAASAPASAPPASSPRPEPEPVKPSGALSAEPRDWAEVRRALKTLGVSRYGTEAEPGGRARFHCVIPLAGRRAVGQHFEAEGNDELEAARAALRRIALWRASEEISADR